MLFTFSSKYYTKFNIGYPQDTKYSKARLQCIPKTII